MQFLFMPPPFEEWWSGIKCYPCPCVHIRPFIFGMLTYNIKTQVEFDLGYTPLIFDWVMGLYKNIAHLAGASVSYGHISSCFRNKQIYVRLISSIELWECKIVVVRTLTIIHFSLNHCDILCDVLFFHSFVFVSYWDI